MGAGPQGQSAYAEACNTKLAEPTLRDRLESRRNRLTRQLVQVEEALRILYADPAAERTYETLKRANC